MKRRRSSNRRRIQAAPLWLELLMAILPFLFRGLKR